MKRTRTGRPTPDMFMNPRSPPLSQRAQCRQEDEIDRIERTAPTIMTATAATAATSGAARRAYVDDDLLRSRRISIGNTVEGIGEGPACCRRLRRRATRREGAGPRASVGSATARRATGRTL